MIAGLFGRNSRLLLIVVIALIIQGPILDRMQIARAHPDLLLLLPVAAGLVAGPGEGAWVGFLAGLAADLSLPSAFGLSALVFTLTGFVVGSLVQALIDGPWWVIPLTGAVGTALGEVLYVAVAVATGQSMVLRQPLPIAYVIGVASAANALLALPLTLCLRWAMRLDENVPGLAR